MIYFELAGPTQFVGLSPDVIAYFSGRNISCHYYPGVSPVLGIFQEDCHLGLTN
jgi:hypothetical protein